jgi:hypothetical protein
MNKPVSVVQSVTQENFFLYLQQRLGAKCTSQGVPSTITDAICTSTDKPMISI